MKPINFNLIILLTLLTAACGNDDTAPEALSENDIQGEWFLSELNASEPVDLNNDNITNLDLTQETNCFDGMTIDFESDAYEFTYPKIDFTGDNSDELVCSDTLNTGTYSLENGTLTATTFIDGSVSTESVSLELSNNELKFTITSSQVNEYLDLENTSNENSDLEFLEFVFNK
ncbi:DUF5004 domain-containing protein [Psychroflexus salinarum]|uniref:DUF5004 domain-containing protein n=1 Tax=Psychroflexus salinarum TaxID=546024 RepID=A0ABW3GPF2_9FLAO